MNPTLKTLEVNTQGRDFVVGDLHGSYNLLEIFAHHVKFDKAFDRLISVGDLVDRGPQSKECLELLDADWFHATYGNHEDLMEGYITDRPIGNWWMQNGGGWWNAIDPIERKFLAKHFLPKLQELPLVMTVPLKNGKRFHVLHAELMSEVPLTDEDFAIEGMLDNPCTEQSSDGDAVIWARGFFMTAYGRAIDEHAAKKWKRGLELDRYFKLFNDKLSTIYSGHSVMQRPTNIGGQVNLDTGAYNAALGKDNCPEWCGLTVTEPLTGKFWTTNLKGTKEVQCLEI